MFCDEHGTIDFCPECLDDDKQQEIDRLRAEVEVLNKLQIWAADNRVVPTELYADVEHALANSDKED